MRERPPSIHATQRHPRSRARLAAPSTTRSPARSASSTAPTRSLFMMACETITDHSGVGVAGRQPGTHTAECGRNWWCSDPTGLCGVIAPSSDHSCKQQNMPSTHTIMQPLHEHAASRFTQLPRSTQIQLDSMRWLICRGVRRACASDAPHPTIPTPHTICPPSTHALTC